MKRAFIKAYNELKKLGCPVFERSDYEGRFLISAEDPGSYKWADYYAYADGRWKGENTGPKLEAVLKKYSLYCEWENAGCLIVFEV
jgi:hypothetical protein